MKSVAVFLALALANVWITPGLADCQIADAKLEEAILQKPSLRGQAHRREVKDLRSLRDAALILRTYGRHEDCKRLLANIRELIAGPPMGDLGDNDEEEATKQMDAREPKVERGRTQGNRGDAGAKALVRIDQLNPGLKADEIMGAEVRSSDDKIIGEVRNIVLATKTRPTYAIVASDGFFTSGPDSIVVPTQFIKVSYDRGSYFLLIPESKIKSALRMPDQDYKWLADKKWRARNDAVFAR
jgi:hypothetical protein